MTTPEKDGATDSSKPWDDRSQSEFRIIELEAQLAAVTKELTHWKAGHLDSHAAEVATLRAALAKEQVCISSYVMRNECLEAQLAASQKERDRYREALLHISGLGRAGIRDCCAAAFRADQLDNHDAEIAANALKERE